MATLPGIHSSLTLESAQFLGALRQANTQLTGLQKSANLVTNALRGLIGAFGIQQVVHLGRQALETAGDLTEMAQSAAVTTTQLQILQVAARDAGVSNEQLQTSLQQFARRAAQAAQESGGLTKLFQQYGIAAHDAEGATRSTAALFVDVAEAVQNAEGPMERTRIATEAFGKAGAKMVAMLSEGAEGWARWAERAEAAGILTDEQVHAADRASDALNQLQGAVGRGFQAGIIETFAGSVSDSTEALIRAREAGEDFGRVIGTALVAGAKAAEFVADNFREIAAAGAALVGLRLGAILFEVAVAASKMAAALRGATIAQAAFNVVASKNIWALIIKGALSAAAAIGVYKAMSFAAEAGTEGLTKELSDLDKLLNEGGGAGGGISGTADAMAKMAEQADRENQQLKALRAAYQGLGSSIENVQAAIKIDDALRAHKITRMEAEESGLLALLVANERLRREVEDLTAAEERRIKVLEDMSTAEGDLRLLQQKAGQRQDLGGKAPGPKIEEELSEPFKNALQSVQAEFTTTFEQMTRGGIRSMQDIADATVDIFANLNANILSLAIFDPAKFKAMAAQAGISPGMLGGVAAGTALFPTALGLFGANQASQNAALGGGIGAGVGALVGSAFPVIGTGLGALAGGAIGTLGGGLLGGLFGGGGSQSNKLSVQGMLGATAGGTGAGAQFVAQLDQQLMDLLNARTELLLDAALKAAPATSVQYSKTPSANDLANLARARIGPAAQAIGLTPHAASRITAGSAEQQVANLQKAIEILKQLEGVRIGPIATQLRDLNAQFDALREEAERLGMSTAGLRAEQARAVAALTRQINLEKIRVAEQVGVMSPVNAALQTLAINFAEAKAQAEALGISTAHLAQEQAVAEAALRRQADLERIAIAETVGTISPLNAALAVLAINFAEARAQATALGIAIPNIAAKQAEQEAEIRVRFAPPSRALPPEPRKIVDPRERVQIAAQVGAIGELGAAQATLAIDMREAGVEARRLGISTRNLAKTTRLAASDLYQQERQRRHAALEAVGIWTPFQRALADLNSQMALASNEARRLGYSTKHVAEMHKRLAGELIQQESMRLTQIAQTVGAMGDLGAALAELAANMALARGEARAAGISTANLARTWRLAASDLFQQDRQRRHANLEAIGLWSPLTHALADLNSQMAMLRNEATRLGYPLTRINEEHRRLADNLIRENQALIDQQALSIVDPFKQLLDPLQEFAKSLTLGNLNPLGQMQAAGDEFRRISELARAGSTTAINQLQGAGEAFIAQAERFGASPGGAAARIEVQSVIESVMADISQAQREASAGLEDTIRLASQRQVDTLNELKTEVRVVAEEIKRLRR